MGLFFCPESQINWSWRPIRLKSTNKTGHDWCTLSRSQSCSLMMRSLLIHLGTLSPICQPTTGTTHCDRSAAFCNWLLHPGRAHRNSSQMKHFVCLVPLVTWQSSYKKHWLFFFVKTWCELTDVYCIIWSFLCIKMIHRTFQIYTFAAQRTSECCILLVKVRWCSHDL